tara:strand:+ start:12093 stop:12509 length:417 start_codon:yes stop_codon:yes gene_type:complete
MDCYQERIIKAINHRESCSLRNNTMMHNSHQTGNDFTSKLFVNDEEIATIFYTHAWDDPSRNTHGGTLLYNEFDHSGKGDYAYIRAIENDTWEIDEISFNETAIARVLGSNAVRYRNFLTKHYVEQGVKVKNVRYVTV